MLSMARFSSRLVATLKLHTSSFKSRVMRRPSSLVSGQLRTVKRLSTTKREWRAIRSSLNTKRRSFKFQMDVSKVETVKSLSHSSSQTAFHPHSTSPKSTRRRSQRLRSSTLFKQNLSLITITTLWSTNNFWLLGSHPLPSNKERNKKRPVRSQHAAALTRVHPRWDPSSRRISSCQTNVSEDLFTLTTNTALLTALKLSLLFNKDSRWQSTVLLSLVKVQPTLTTTITTWLSRS